MADVERDNIEIGTFSQLSPSSSGCSLRAKVIGTVVVGTRKCSRTGRQLSAADVLIGDETGCAFLTAAGAQLSLLQPGKSVLIRNFRVNMVRGHLRLAVDRWGCIEPMEPGLTCEVNELNNRSYAEFVRIQPQPLTNVAT